MTANPQGTDGFQETHQIPTGRKTRNVAQSVWDHLEKSAESFIRGKHVGFTKTASPQIISELKRDLGIAAVRAKYDVTVETKKISDKLHTLVFSAKHREPADTAEVPETPAK